jgi:hypothetical protein
MFSHHKTGTITDSSLVSILLIRVIWGLVKVGFHQIINLFFKTPNVGTVTSTIVPDSGSFVNSSCDTFIVCAVIFGFRRPWRWWRRTVTTGWRRRWWRIFMIVRWRRWWRRMVETSGVGIVRAIKNPSGEKNRCWDGLDLHNFVVRK